MKNTTTKTTTKRSLRLYITIAIATFMINTNGTYTKEQRADHKTTTTITTF